MHPSNFKLNFESDEEDNQTNKIFKLKSSDDEFDEQEGESEYGLFQNNKDNDDCISKVVKSAKPNFFDSDNEDEINNEIEKLNKFSQGNNKVSKKSESNVKIPFKISDPSNLKMAINKTNMINEVYNPKNNEKDSKNFDLNKSIEESLSSKNELLSIKSNQINQTSHQRSSSLAARTIVDSVISKANSTIQPTNSLSLNNTPILSNTVNSRNLSSTSLFTPSFTVKDSSFASNILNTPTIQNDYDKSTKSLIKENIELKTIISKQSAEIKFLLSKQDEKPDFKHSIDRFLLDKPYWFDCYKSKKDKINLLKEAINSNDGNAILAVVLFIKRTLTPLNFYDIILTNQIALNHYSFYLEQMNDVNEIYNLNMQQKNYPEAANNLYFKSIITDNELDLSEKKHKFNELERHFNYDQLSSITQSTYYLTAKKHLTLLDIQKEIMKNKSSFLRKDENKQMEMDSLFGNSLLYTLSFRLKYNKELIENDNYSIEEFKKKFELTPKEFSICYIKSMAEIGLWSDIERFTSQKGLFNMVQKQTVSYETIVYIIVNLKGPVEQIKKYLSLVEDLEQRKSFALKLKLTDLVIECFKLQKDRIGLYNYRNQFKEDSVDYIKANILLKDDKVKWKN